MVYCGPIRSQDELNAGLALASSVFGDTELGETISVEKHFYTKNVPGFVPEHCIVHVGNDGEVSGLVVAVDRTIWLHGAKVPSTYLTSICVHPDLRGQGISVTLMEQTHKALQERGIALSFLIARRAVDHYYTRFGYWGLSTHNRLTFGTSAKATSGSFSMRDASADDIGFMTKLYEANYQYVSGAIVRTPAIWNYIIYKAQRAGEPFQLLLHGDQPIGYCQIGGGMVHEIALEETANAEDCLHCLANGLEQASVTLAVGGGHPVARVLASTCEQTMRVSPFGGHMGKVVNATVLAEALDTSVPNGDSADDYQSTLSCLGLIHPGSATHSAAKVPSAINGSFNLIKSDHL